MLRVEALSCMRLIAQKTCPGKSVPHVKCSLDGVFWV